MKSRPISQQEVWLETDGDWSVGSNEYASFCQPHGQVDMSSCNRAPILYLIPAGLWGLFALCH